MGENRARYRITNDDFAEHPPVKTTAASIAQRELAELAVLRVGSAAELARRLEVAPSHIARVRKGLVGFGVDRLLGLADILEVEPVKVLHTCGHPRLADRLIQLQNNTPRRSVTALCEAIDRLCAPDRDLIIAIVARVLSSGQADPGGVDRVSDLRAMSPHDAIARAVRRGDGTAMSTIGLSRTQD